jgi:anti-sigma regulatory factor (Ser/Thr protein kinase)
MVFTIVDSGMPFDPTLKEEVDTTLSAEERPIGGLGIHLVRKLMDDISYQYVDNKNVLTLKKKLNKA